MSLDLTQAEADELIAMEKHFIGNEKYNWPSLGTKIAIPLSSTDGREEFVLDIATSALKISKLTIQNRARVTTVLVRLDVDGPPHRNPDDVEIPCPHIHVFKEGFADKWAFPLPKDVFTNLSDKRVIYMEFASYCKIVLPPILEQGLF